MDEFVANSFMNVEFFKTKSFIHLSRFLFDSLNSNAAHVFKNKDLKRA